MSDQPEPVFVSNFWLHDLIAQCTLETPLQRVQAVEVQGGFRVRLSNGVESQDLPTVYPMWHHAHGIASRLAIKFSLRLTWAGAEGDA